MCEDERYWQSVKIASTTLEDSSVGRVPEEQGGDVSSNLTPSTKRRYFSYEYVIWLKVNFCVFILLLLLPVKVGEDFC